MNEYLSSTDYDLIRNPRRRTETLAKWWAALNRWKWPKEIPDEERRQLLGENPRRDALMKLIATEVGQREIVSIINEREGR